MQSSVGPYRIIRKLGEGGMGVVYAAEDSRLGRSVALKTVRSEMADAEGRERLRREARAAATISHPNICQLFEIGEYGSELVIAMELLEGEPLSARIARGSLPLRDAIEITLQVLAALAALHRRGILHRDLKPSNIFLTEHGAKLLDFGVARADDPHRTVPSRTGSGSVIGTPRYMAPEQASGGDIDARSDLFSVGAVLYEMLAGRPAFDGETAIRVLHAVMYEQPPVLTGSPAIAAVDRVIHRALAKQPSARPATADDLAEALRTAMRTDSSGVDTARARRMSRLVVLPFRLLRPDPDVDFLAFSLSDAVTSSLSGLGSLVVRSSLTAAKLGADATDLKKIAEEADVDVVLSGTLLRAGSQVRLTAQLAEAPGGAILWSHMMQVSFDDIFQLHDTLVRNLVDALAIPLTAREHRMLGRDVPSSAKAYEFYLRANELAKESSGWDAAVGLYQECLDEDPQYAPAWARLGRVFRMIGKYNAPDDSEYKSRARQAVDRALGINPDLALAHTVLAQIDVDSGRGIEAMVRLLRQAAHVADPDLYAGLCHACRYCGLLDASIAAHEQAVRLDPKISTSVIHTWFLLRKYEAVIACGVHLAPYIGALAMAELGRRDEAVDMVKTLAPRMPPKMREFMQTSLISLNDQPTSEDLQKLRGAMNFFRDPEGLFYAVRNLARVGEIDTAVASMSRVVDSGYFCYPAFAADPWLDPMRGHAAFQAALARAKERHEAAVAAFKDAGGDHVVGTKTE